MSDEVQTLFEVRHDDVGVLRIELWPEGFVFWAGGEIRWKSWERAKPSTFYESLALEREALIEDLTPFAENKLIASAICVLKVANPRPQG